MARPQKQTIAYFSHDADAGEGKTLTILFNHFGHEGLSAWWLLLERISNTRNHVISIGNPESFEYLSAKLHFQPERLREILSKMADLEAIDKPLFEAGYIWCQNFVDRQEPVYKYRHQPLPSKPTLSGKETELSGKETELSIPIIPQREYSKESIVKRVKGTPSNDKLPEWLDKETWDAFLEMRKAKKAVPTPHAKALLIKELERLKVAGDDPNAVLNQSTMRNYTGVFPLNKSGGQDGAHRRNSTKLPNRDTGYTEPPPDPELEALVEANRKRDEIAERESRAHV